MEKILFVLNNMNIGGTEKAFLNYIDTLPENEYELSLLLLEETGGYIDFIPPRVKVLILDNYALLKPEIMDPPLQIVKQLFRKKQFMRGIQLGLTHFWFKLSGSRVLYYEMVLQGCEIQEQYDKAIAYCGPFDFISVLVLQCIHAKEKIQWIHFDVNHFQFNTKTCKLIYPKFNKIYVVSETARKSLIRKIPEIEGKTETKMNTVSRAQCRKQSMLGTGFEDNYSGIRILTVGRLSMEKGQDIIPFIAKRLREKNVKFKWYLIGDGQLRKTIEDLCVDNAVKDSICFLGTQINPYIFFKGADIYVQTSIHEGYCITLGEAKVFDLPIISTECAGAHEQLDDYTKSIIVKRNVAEMTDAIERGITDWVLQ